MYKHGILKVATVTPTIEVGNPQFNRLEIERVLLETDASLILFPELSLTGYTCGDLFYQDSLINEALKALEYLLKVDFNGIAVIGMPINVDGVLYNCAVVFEKGRILGVVPKQFIPNTGEFYEKRWFNSASNILFDEIMLLGKKVPFGSLLFNDYEKGIKIGIEICQDMWVPISPGNLLSLAGANMILNLSASNTHLNKDTERRNAVLEHSRKNHGAYIYTSSGMTESTSETVFSGHNIHAVLGKLNNEAMFDCPKTEVLTSDIDFGYINFHRRKDTNLKDALHKYHDEYREVEIHFKETDYTFAQTIEKYPFVPKNQDSGFNEIRKIQKRALSKRLIHLNYPKIIMGISGGLDSTLALLVAVDTFKYLDKDLKDIVCVSMPGLATSKRTYTNAKALCEILGVTYKEIDIKDESNLHFEMIDQKKDDYSVTYENTQARIRTMTLMNLANKLGGIVLGTGNLSEIALGFMTYSGDQMSMYAINSGLPKTLVKFQTRMYALYFKEAEKILLDILETPISPELIKNQKTEEILGNYDYNDFLIYRHLVCGDDVDKLIFMLKHAFELSEKSSKELVNRFIKRFYSMQFKRQTMPDGPKILEIGLSPRSDFKLPSDVVMKP